MDELRAMLEHSYLQTSLMHKFFSSRVRELEEAYRILREKTYKALERREKMIQEYKNAIEILHRDLEYHRHRVARKNDDKEGVLDVNRAWAGKMLDEALTKLKEIKNYKHEEEL